MRSLHSSLIYGVGGLWSLASAGLLPESELVTNCYNFPAEPFSYTNNVKNSYGSSPHLPLQLGSPAVNFTLHDIDGVAWNLDKALTEGGGKPVILIWGMSTCPAYQGLDSEGSSNTWAYWDQHELVESHTDKGTYVHMYGPEPHPASPDMNFDSGKLAANFWSTERQANTYDERLEAARAIRDVTHPLQVILPDYLTGNPYSDLNQPVWCTYANGARSAIIISSSGIIFYQQTWLDVVDLGNAINAYWKQDGSGTYTAAPQEKGPRGPASRPVDKKQMKQLEPRTQILQAQP